MEKKYLEKQIQEQHQKIKETEQSLTDMEERDRTREARKD